MTRNLVHELDGLAIGMAANSLARDTVSSAAREIERLQAALKECGAPFMSPPTTVMGASAYVAEEFERRMNIAANTLNDGTREPPVAASSSVKVEE